MTQEQYQLAPIGIKHYIPIVYYDKEIFLDLYLNSNYMISNFGRIYSKVSQFILRPHLDNNGFERIELVTLDQKRHSFYIHDLVMMTFLPRQDYDHANILIKHINGIRNQNVYCPGHPLHNLEWIDLRLYAESLINILPKEVNEEYRIFYDDPRYLISNTGKIYSAITNLFLRPKLDNGYARISINNKMYLIHRAIMITFAYRPDFQNLEVNHIDGNKLNNCYYGEKHPLTNLEWCTSLENRIHASEHGLVSHGETHHLAIYSDEFIHYICQYMNIYPLIDSKTLASMLNIEYNSQFISLVSQLRCGVRWKHILKFYPNISRVGHLPAGRKVSEEMVHSICELIQQNPAISASEIAKILNVEYSHYFLNLIFRIRHKKAWVSISCNYQNIYK